MEGAVAHSIEAQPRTEDVRMKEVSPFSKMLLSDAVRKGLHQAGFVYPTVIQATAIPVGKSGLDLLVQSKSGTGKTLIFCSILLEAYSSEVREPQSLIVVPTREIAVQIESVLNQIGRFCHGFRAACVIGGLDVADDRKKLQGAKAVVGTPGRLLHLIQNEVLNTSRIRLLILDEADKMYTQSFRQDLQRIQKALPAKRQTIACSATFCNDLDKEVAKIMKNPLLISTEERATLLVGIKQFVYELHEQKTSILEMGAKLDALKDIFGRIAFKQCLIFAGSQSRADSYRNYLEKEGWPCELISGAQDQKTRLEMFRKFREFKTRILIATDLMSRGIDSENVNLVINLELPTDVVTYLHRIGRAGRFGSHGIAISFLASEKDRTVFRRLTSQVGSGMNVLKFPKPGSSDNERDMWDFSDIAAECKYYGCFGTDLEAPLASQEFDSSTESSENKENHSNNANIGESNSSIDTKTFHIDTTGVQLGMLDLLVDRPEYNTQAAQKLTPDSRQSSSQRLPSSNTIDDASSIAADSVRSSQQDISKYQSILMQKVAIPTLVEFLVDQKSERSGEEKGVSKKPQIDLFDDYRKSVQQKEESDSFVATPKSSTKNLANNFKALLIDQPKPTKVSTENQKDIYSEYANFEGEESSSSISLATGASEANSNKATFIMSVATPSQVRGESIEEITTPSQDLSQVCSTSDAQSISEVKHFTSPAHNQAQSSAIPDVIPAPHMGLPMRQQNLTINVGAQVQIPPDPAPALHNVAPRSPPSPSLLSDDTMSSGQQESPESSGSNTERGASSGFDEQASSSSSSGIENDEYSTSTGEEESTDEEDYSYAETDDEDEEDDTIENNYSYSEDNEENAETEEVGSQRGSDISDKVELEDEQENEDTESVSIRKSKSQRTRERRSPSHANAQAYQSAYEQWVQLYWRQLSFLQDYVRASSKVRRRHQ